MSFINHLVYKKPKDGEKCWISEPKGVQIAYFVQTTVQNISESLFTIINDIEKQQILMFKKLEPASVWYFAREITEMIKWLSK